MLHICSFHYYLLLIILYILYDQYIDIDECTREHDCDTKATCTNTMGSYGCTCNDGWSGNGTVCTNKNECDQSTPVCHVKATCTDTIGSFTCKCNDGFVGNGVQSCEG